MLALLAVPFGLVLVLVEARWGPLATLDAGARDDFNDLARDSPAFTTAMRVVSDLGSAAVQALVFGALVLWLLVRRRRRLAAFTAVTTLGGAILNATVKALVDRARPVLQDPVSTTDGLSFPSGHAQSAVVTAGVLLLVLAPRSPAWRSLAMVWVLLVGLSRVALGVHFVSDVVAGWALGGAWLALCVALFRLSR